MRIINAIHVVVHTLSAARLCLAAVLVWGGLGSPSSAEVVLQTKHLCLRIAADGTVASLTAKPAGTEYRAASPCPLAIVCRGGRMVPASEGKYAAVTGRWVYRGGTQLPSTAVTRQGDLLHVEFGQAHARATYRLRCSDDYLAFELLGVEGQSIDRIEFLRLDLRRLPYLGQWIGAVYDDRFGICLCGGNAETNIEMLPRDGDVRLTAAAEARVALRGPTAVLFGCPEPKTRLLDAMARVEQDFHLPSGVAARRSPLQRLSYLWAANPTPQNIDRYIHWAKLGGFRVLLFSYTAFSRGAGHYLWNDSYPHGMADLKRVTDAIRAAGLQAGLHLHYCKTRKGDPYTTPVPDPRLHKERRFTLATPLDATARTLTVREDPTGCTLDKGRRILHVGQEWIVYENYTTRPPYQFTGCERGHLQTTAAAHPAGGEVGLLDVDTWDIFVRFDQTTDIQDEVAQRIADIYRQTGPYAMVYFDGAEDVHEPFWYHVALAQHRVFRRLDPPPAVCESAQYTHFSWHMISRSNAYDSVAAAEWMKDFCRLMPCPTAEARSLDFSRIQFGWLGRFGYARPQVAGKRRSNAGLPGPDVFEYVAGRAAAWDCPLSIHATLPELESNPRAADCLAAIKTWEDARLGNHLCDADRRLLRNVRPEDACYVPCFDQRGIYQNIVDNRDLTPSQRRILADRREHHLFLNEAGRYELVELHEVPQMAQGPVRGYWFRRTSKPADVYVLAWAVEGQRQLRVPGAALVAMRPFGTPWPCRLQGDSSQILVGSRTYLLFQHTDADAVVRRLAAADSEPERS
jgi:hypothetical protein